MRPVVPRFPLLEEPGWWDELTLLAATIALEAEGEPYEGQLAVGCVVMNRVRLWKRSVHAVILGSDEQAYDDGKPYEAWSCWNDNYRAHATARLSELVEFPAAWKAAATAIWTLAPDPTGSATFYLNVELTKKQRGGTLPGWAADPLDATRVDESKVTVVIERHTFLIA